ncbi:MAG: endonuclease domain-containing protein [Candidatus Zambryskibacteria bacterium]
MTVIFNQKNNTSKRRTLRNNMTDAEIILWKKLGRKQMLGYKFRRQYSIDKFVVDFYCPKLKLAIEIDGDLHYQSNEIEDYDANRQILISTFGISFLRFQNPEIYKNIDGVLRTIESVILKSKYNKPPLKSPPF